MDSGWSSIFSRKKSQGDSVPERLKENLRSRNRSLDLSDCGIAVLPKELESHTWLHFLRISNNPISSLEPVGALLYLKGLNAEKTAVHDVSPLSHLRSIEMIELSDTKVSDLSPLLETIRRGVPVSLYSRRLEVTGIFLGGCPLIHPPPEIAKQGKDAILNYFWELQSGVDHLYEAKMLIVGPGGAGKTSLLTRLYKPGHALPNESETTKGIYIHRHEFQLPNGRWFRLNVWDFAGQEIYTATHQFFLTRRSLYVLVDDTRRDEKTLAEFRPWLEMIDVFSGHSPVLVFQNEKGGRSKAIDFVGIKGHYDNVKELFTGNLEHVDAADRLRTAIEYFGSSLPHIGEELPARWIKVRADIETRAALVPYIAQHEYFDIYSRYLDFDRVRALHLSRYLHDLGVFLHFQDDPLLSRSVILQNQWATEAVFLLLDDEVVKGKIGRFNVEDCQRLWCSSAYADMHPELLALMKNFELCYELKDANPQTWLATQLLPPSRPNEIHEWAQPGDFVVRYRYAFLPKGVISRLIVRLHRYVQSPEMAWRTGVVFERDKTQVLVELLPDGVSIELRGRGPERQILLNVVAADLDALNDSFHGLRDRVDKLIPCNCESCLSALIPHFFRQKDLIRRKEHSVRFANCEVSFQNVNVLELLEGNRNEPTQDGNAVRKDIRLFLASSSELRDDRDAFDLHFRQHNDVLRKKGLYLEVRRWENFLDAISETRLQDEYNKAIQEADVFVCLFFTKTGKFTEEEFDTAYQRFRETGKPRLFVYLKNADIKSATARKEDLNSLWAFREKLNTLGHFPTTYDNVEHLILQFQGQLDKLLLA